MGRRALHRPFAFHSSRSSIASSSSSSLHEEVFGVELKDARNAHHNSPTPTSAKTNMPMMMMTTTTKRRSFLNLAGLTAKATGRPQQETNSNDGNEDGADPASTVDPADDDSVEVDMDGTVDAPVPTLLSSMAVAVAFAPQTQVRVYAQILGDHPCCSTGCPIQLGWRYQECREPVVEHDTTTSRRPSSIEDLKLTPDERKRIILNSRSGRGGTNRSCGSSSISSSSSSSNGSDSEDNSFVEDLSDDNQCCDSRCDGHDDTNNSNNTTDDTCFAYKDERELHRDCRRLNRSRIKTHRGTRQVQREFFGKGEY